MREYILGRKHIIDEIKKNNVFEVHLISFTPEIQKICSEKKIPLFIHNHKDEFCKKYDFVTDCIAFLKKSFTVTSSIEEFLDLVERKHNQKQTIIILDSIHDSRNFGAIIRSAKAFESNNIIFKKDNQVEINDHVVKASAGAIHDAIFLKTTNLSQAVDKLKKLGYWIYVTTLNNAVALETVTEFPSKTVFIFGNEDKGVSKNLEDKADHKIKISMSENLDSLNVSVSAAIILHYLSFVVK